MEWERAMGAAHGMGRGGWRSALAFGLALALPIAPVTLRNLVVGGDGVLISSQGGIAFYTGNNPDSDGAHGSPAGFTNIGGNWEYYDCVRWAESETGRTLRPSEVSAFFFRRGLEFWRDDPGAALSLWFRKWGLLLGRHRVSNNRDIYRAIDDALGDSAIRWLFADGWDTALLSLGLAGLVMLGRRGWVLAAFVAVYAFTVVAFFVAARYRIPILAALAPPAGVAVERWGRAMVGRRAVRRPVGKRWWTAVGVGTSVALLSLWGAKGVGGVPEAQGWFARGVSLAALGRAEEAERAFRRVLELDPSYPRVWLNLGNLALAAGDEEEAESAFRRELAIHPTDPLAANNLGAVYLRRGDLARAERWFRRATELQPNYFRAYRNLAQTLVRAGDLKGALAVLDRALVPLRVAVEYQPDAAGIYSDRAAVLLRMGRTAEAIDDYRRAVALNPERVEPRMGLGSALGRSGRLEEARRVLEGVVRDAPERVEAHVDLGNVLAALGDLEGARRHYEAAERLDPSRPEAAFALGTLAARQGDREGARRWFRRALERDPRFGPARAAMGALSASEGTGR